MTNMFSFKLSPDLADALRLREEQLGYSSLAGYIKGLIRKDIKANECHDEALEWSKLSWIEQDGIDAGLLSLVKDSLGEKSDAAQRVPTSGKEGEVGV